MWPQIIYIAFIFMGIGVSAGQNGKPKEGHHSFWHDFFTVLLGACLFYWGGFFDVFLGVK